MIHLHQRKDGRGAVRGSVLLSFREKIDRGEKGKKILFAITQNWPQRRPHIEKEKGGKKNVIEYKFIAESASSTRRRKKGRGEVRCSTVCGIRAVRLRRDEGGECKNLPSFASLRERACFLRKI